MSTAMLSAAVAPSLALPPDKLRSPGYPVREPETQQQDPSKRYTKFELLGAGACKKVYKAFDEAEGIEVAWNQVAVGEFVWASEKDRSRVFAEIRVLKQLKHKNIMSLHDWWYDPKQATLNFITELFTDGTLRQYRRKHKHLDTTAIKRWAWQMLQGLVYLHGHNPPIIHRDLKADNIFVNGSSGVVKIGDLGFATLHQVSVAMSVIGTPEFMAPELYEEQYSERVDVYSYGMCLLELATLQYPYSECTNAAQIYKKVTKGIPPEGLALVKDEELKAFISLCICHDPVKRPEARCLLKHPFFDCIKTASAGRPLATATSGGVPSPGGVPRPASSEGKRPSWSGSAGGAAPLSPSPAPSPSHGPSTAPSREGSPPCSQPWSPVAASGGGSRGAGRPPLPTLASGPFGTASHAAQPHSASATPPLLSPRGPSNEPSPHASSSTSRAASQGSGLHGAGSAPVLSPSASTTSRTPPGESPPRNGGGEHQADGSFSAWASTASAATLSAFGRPSSQSSPQLESLYAFPPLPPVSPEARTAPTSPGSALPPLPPHHSLRATAQPPPPTCLPPHLDPSSSSSPHQPPGRSPSSALLERHDSDLSESELLFDAPSMADLKEVGRDGGGGSGNHDAHNAASDGSLSYAGAVLSPPAPRSPTHEASSTSLHAASDPLQCHPQHSDSAFGRASHGDSGEGEEDSEEDEPLVAVIPEADFASFSQQLWKNRVSLACRSRANHLLSFSMSFTNDLGVRKKVGFQYDEQCDTAGDLALEMVENLSLNLDEAGLVATRIQEEIERFNREVAADGSRLSRASSLASPGVGSWGGGSGGRSGGGGGSGAHSLEGAGGSGNGDGCH